MTVKSEYGRALFLLAKEIGSTEEIKCDLTAAVKAMEKAPEYTKILDTPAIAKEEKLKLSDEAFRGLSEYVVNLIKMLAEKRLTYSIGKISEHFIKRYDDANGIERVDAVTVVPMTDAQIRKLEAKLKDITGKKQIVVKNTVDPAMLGGMKLRYSGIQLDGSIRTRLDSFEKSIGALVI